MRLFFPKKSSCAVKELLTSVFPGRRTDFPDLSYPLEKGRAAVSSFSSAPLLGYFHIFWYFLSPFRIRFYICAYLAFDESPCALQPGLLLPISLS